MNLKGKIVLLRAIEESDQELLLSMLKIQIEKKRRLFISLNKRMVQEHDVNNYNN